MGTLRYTEYRKPIYGEAYLQIPISDAKRLDFYNSNEPKANIIYTCSTVDGFFKDVNLKASGNGDKTHAKQLRGDGNLNY